MIRLLIVLLHLTSFQTGNLAFVLGILLKMCCFMSARGSWLRTIDAGQYVGAIFSDLAKACNILLQKLDHYGIRGGAFWWMKSLCVTEPSECVIKYLFIQGIGYHWSSSRIFIRIFICSPYNYVNDLLNSVSICDVNLYAEFDYCHSHLQQ